MLITTIIYLHFSMVHNLKNIRRIINNERQPDPPHTEKRVALILHGESSTSKKIIKGAQTTATEENLKLTPFTVKPSGQLNLSDYYRLANLSDYDGIITGGNPRLIPLINKAAEEEIPTVTILSDIADSRRISYVGIDYYQTGIITGNKLLRNFPDSSPRLAVVSTQNEEDEYTPSSEYLKVFGFQVAAAAKTEAKIITWEKTGPTVLEALQTVSRILENNPEINGLLTTGPELTLAAAQILENEYPERDIELIGFGNTESIREYVDKGIISASVIDSPKLIGSSAVREINSYLENGSVNLYSNIDVDFLEGPE
ncbi:MAG: sugar ABC transporter substrate-binding protein [Halanaerobiales bacterium]